MQVREVTYREAIDGKWFKKTDLRPAPTYSSIDYQVAGETVTTIRGQQHTPATDSCHGGTDRWVALDFSKIPGEWRAMLFAQGVANILFFRNKKNYSWDSIGWRYVAIDRNGHNAMNANPSRYGSNYHSDPVSKRKDGIAKLLKEIFEGTQRYYQKRDGLDSDELQYMGGFLDAVLSAAEIRDDAKEEASWRHLREVDEEAYYEIREKNRQDQKDYVWGLSVSHIYGHRVNGGWAWSESTRSERHDALLESFTDSPVDTLSQGDAGYGEALAARARAEARERRADGEPGLIARADRRDRQRESA